MRILIANRGEIARRINRTAHRLGHETVAVYADPDQNAPFVDETDFKIRIGPADLQDSYLNIAAILDAASRTSATAVHPGYGFLSESAVFAQAVLGQGLGWIGPQPAVISSMGTKIKARAIASAAAVPVIPGVAEATDVDLAAAAAAIGYPVLVKASAGGGGKGIRIAEGPDDLDSALAEARAESMRSFGDDALIIERFIQRPRHIEVQIVGDHHGMVIDLGTRECSVQRRYQKIIEEAPAPNLDPTTVEGLRAAARDLANAVGYDSVGTVEFILDDENGEFFFLEVNTRLQVEHPVTEAITGLDLVELQIRIASGEPLNVTQDDVSFTGHAIEARINAEDPHAGFLPQTGTVERLSVPPEARWDSAVVTGSVISPHYDPLMAKLIEHGPDRDTTRLRLIRDLDSLMIGGVISNAGYLRWLLTQPAIVEGRVTTRFVDETPVPEPADADQILDDAAHAWTEAVAQARANTPWAALTRFRMTPHQPISQVILCEPHGPSPATTVIPTENDRPRRRALVDLNRRLVTVNHYGATHSFAVLTRTQHWAPQSEATTHGGSDVVAPFPGVVTEIVVAVGDAVEPGDVVLTIEAMKMLHTMKSPGGGTVTEVKIQPGDQVASGEVLVRFDEE